MITKLERDWGVVQGLHVEADTFTALKGACEVACVPHKTATHFYEKTEPDGSVSLGLAWTDGCNTLCYKELPIPLTGASEIAIFCKSWLEKKGKWPDKRPNTDGDTKEGFCLKKSHFNDLFLLKPTYIIYGK